MADGEGDLPVVLAIWLDGAKKTSSISPASVHLQFCLKCTKFSLQSLEKEKKNQLYSKTTLCVESD